MEVSQTPRWDDDTSEWITSDGRRFSVRPDGESGFAVISYGVDADNTRNDLDAPVIAVYATESDAKEAALRLAEAHEPEGRLP